MHFTLKQLKYIEATGRLGSIANAATELHISQSSITAAIGAFERQIGYDLFVRTPAKGISVTPAGADAIRLIRAFIIQGRHFEAEVMSVGGDATGSVRISCYATAAPSFLPPILQNFKSTYPDASIKLLEGNMEATISYLTNGEADLAFTYDEMVGNGHEFTPLFKAAPYALMAADDPLANGTSVSMADLAERPMVLLDLPRTKDYFIGMFDQLGLKPTLAHSTRSAEIARALVSGGYGYSILNICPPDYRRDDTRFRTLPISDNLRAPVFGIITMSGMRQPKIVEAFVQQCVSLAQAGAFDDITVH